nr:hypothetical protein [Deltaproteobacteria bacterium]
GATGAPPPPRSLSGQPRIEQTYEPGTITVITAYDDLKDTPADVPVTLVAYKSDESIKVSVKPTTSTGRVEFGDLDRSGNTIYFAMAQLVRNGAIDRGYTVPVQLDSRGGVHVILSGEKRDSTKPPVDDFARVQAQDTPTEAGKVRVVISGAPELPATVKIFDAVTHQVVAEGTAVQGQADRARVDFQSQFAARADIPVGMLGVVVHGGAGKDEPMAGLEVTLVPATEGAPALATPLTGITDDNGQAIVKVPPTITGPLKAVLTVNGKQHTSESFEVGTSGGALEVIAHWEDKGRIEAMIDVPHIVGRVLYAESVNRKRTYRSAPFQTIPTAGTQLAMFFYPRTMFTFTMGGAIEDQLMGVQGRFSVTNFSWFPFSAGPDGLVIPLPKGYRGIIVGETDQDKVSSDPVQGFRILRPIPPGGLTFHGGFSLPVEGDSIQWAQDLPLGTVNSSLKFLKVPGMVVRAPPGVAVQDAEMQNGTPIYLMEPIQIKSGQSMVLSVGGLPAMPGWRIWVPRIIGLVVVATMLAGVAFAMGRRKAATGATEAREVRRNQLLDELVELDRAGSKDKRRRETLIVELEALWGDDN